ncbi:toxin-antitoxin system YwqK family antitoxin [Flavobacterium sp. XS2P12]|uniref:toxin-antitoxin system YwqK family antitoxin n=1 Tax=Flavobacterium melibiosi TaxID=3398734 RepID=UPI003A8A38A1
MKKCIILVAILFSGIIFAQKGEPVLEPFGKKVKATYFFENGQVQQEGFFENGKLEGVWVSFDEKGNKTSSGEYQNGRKTGKWFFWSEKSDNGFSNLSEVDYSNNRIASVKNWKQEVVVSID